MKELTDEYIELVMKVAAIDKKASYYMVHEAPKLSGFTPEGYLSGCFIFSDTPQRGNYWWYIVDKLREAAP